MNNTMKTWQLAIVLIVGAAIIIAVAYGAFMLNRYVNYNLSYEKMVQETVREMVKEEALK